MDTSRRSLVTLDAFGPQVGSNSLMINKAHNCANTQRALILDDRVFGFTCVAVSARSNSSCEAKRHRNGLGPCPYLDALSDRDLRHNLMMYSDSYN
jgi:hypothetical protein